MWRWYEVLDDIDGRGQIRIRMSLPGKIPVSALPLFAIFSGERLAIGQPKAHLSYNVLHDEFGTVTGIRVRDYDRIDEVVSKNEAGLSVCRHSTWAARAKARASRAGDTTRAQ